MPARKEKKMKDNKAIKCKKCGQNFVWTREEQDFYKEKGLKPPVYCLICRSIYNEAEKDDFRHYSSSADLVAS